MIRLSDNNYRDYRQRTTTTITTTWGTISVKQNYTIITLNYSRRQCSEVLDFFNSENTFFYSTKIVSTEMLSGSIFFFFLQHFLKIEK